MNDFLRTKIRFLSFFLIVLVVFVHSYNIDIKINNGIQYSSNGLVFFIEEFFSQGLNRIASPLFFIISGYLFFANLNGTAADFLRKLKKRIKTLIVPYLLWSLAGILLFWALQLHPLANVFFTKTLIRDMDLKEILNNLILAPVPYQLWYIRDLMMFVLLSPVFFVLIQELRLLVLISCIVFWIVDFNFIFFRSQSLFFYIVGASLAMHFKDLTMSEHKVKGLPFLMIWLTFVLIKTFLYCNNLSTPGVLNLLHKAAIVTGILTVNFLYDNFYARSEVFMQRLKPVIVYSFFVFAAHEPLLTIINKSMLNLTGNNSAGLLAVYFIAPVITITGCLIVAKIFKQHLPGFYSVITGGR